MMSIDRKIFASASMLALLISGCANKDKAQPTNEPSAQAETQAENGVDLSMKTNGSVVTSNEQDIEQMQALLERIESTTNAYINTVDALDRAMATMQALYAEHGVAERKVDAMVEAAAHHDAIALDPAVPAAEVDAATSALKTIRKYTGLPRSAASDIADKRLVVANARAEAKGLWEEVRGRSEAMMSEPSIEAHPQVEGQMGRAEELWIEIEAAAEASDEVLGEALSRNQGFAEALDIDLSMPSTNDGADVTEAR